MKICKKHTKYESKELRNGFIIVNITKKSHKRPLGIILNCSLKIEFQQRHTKKKKCSQLKQTIEKQAVEIDVKKSGVKFIYVVHKC